MRFVHMADIHFDTPFRVLASKKDLADKRRLEQREAFTRAIEYVKENNIPFLFISGDLYEQEYIRESTIVFINNLFKEIPNTKIFISPGNHDPYLNNSFYNTFNWNNNVTIFGGQIKRIELEEADIYGYGFSDFYCTNSNVDEIEIKNKEKINILITHGSLNASKTQDLQYNPVSSVKLKKVGFDYVALGHIHKANYKNNEDNFIYSGSLISFGFDELGEHGILDIEINKNNYEKNYLNNLEIKNNYEENNLNNLEFKNNYEKNILNNLKIENNYKENIKNYFTDEIKNEKNARIRFVKIEKEKFVEKNINIDDVNSEEDVIEKLNDEEYEKEKFYKIILEGSKKIELNPKRICKLVNNKNILKVKDKIECEYDFDKLAEQKNLKGMFVKNLLEKIKKHPEDRTKIEEALKIGLKMFE